MRGLASEVLAPRAQRKLCRQRQGRTPSCDAGSEFCSAATKEILTTVQGMILTSLLGTCGRCTQCECHLAKADGEFDPCLHPTFNLVCLFLRVHTLSWCGFSWGTIGKPTPITCVCVVLLPTFGQEIRPLSCAYQQNPPGRLKMAKMWRRPSRSEAASAGNSISRLVNL